MQHWKKRVFRILKMFLKSHGLLVPYVEKYELMRLCFRIFYFPEVTTFQQLQPEVEKLLRFFWYFPIFWKSPHFTQNQLPLFACVFVKLDLCKLIWKLLTQTFYFCKKQITFCKRLCHLKELGKYFLKTWYFHSQAPKFQKFFNFRLKLVKKL